MAWHDRFSRPNVESLRQDLHGHGRQLFDNLLAALREVDHLDEQCVWHGECWRWTIEFRLPGGTDPIAVVIPCPTDLQMAMPMSREFVRSLPLKRLKRTVRDGLELAQDPFDTHWGVWSITGIALIDDLLDLVEMKQQHLARRAV